MCFFLLFGELGRSQRLPPNIPTNASPPPDTQRISMVCPSALSHRLGVKDRWTARRSGLASHHGLFFAQAHNDTLYHVFCWSFLFDGVCVCACFFLEMHPCWLVAWLVCFFDVVVVVVSWNSKRSPDETGRVEPRCISLYDFVGGATGC